MAGRRPKELHQMTKGLGRKSIGACATSGRLQIGIPFRSNDEMAYTACSAGIGTTNEVVHAVRPAGSQRHHLNYESGVEADAEGHEYRDGQPNAWKHK